MFGEGLRLIRRYLFGTDEDPPPLEGSWEREDGPFRGAVIRVLQIEDEVVGRVVYVPPRMQAAGWSCGDLKWRRLEASGPGLFSGLDMRRYFDMAQAETVYFDYLPCELRLSPQGLVLRPKPGSASAKQMWNRLEQPSFSRSIRTEV